jgi:hypothetical protein
MTTTNARSTREDGIATMLVVLVIVLVTLIVGVLLQSSLAAQKDAARQVSRASALSGVDTGLAHYRAALDGELIGPFTNYQLTRSAFTDPSSPLAALVNVGRIHLINAPVNLFDGTQRIDSTNTVCKDPMHGTVRSLPQYRRSIGDATGWDIQDSADSRFIVEEGDHGQACTYWDVYRVDPLPLAPASINSDNDRQLRVVIRSWTAKSEPRFVTVIYSQSSFADYQILSDDSIDFGTGVRVSGKVHSNGYDGRATTVDGPTINCNTGTAILTSARGAINAPVRCRRALGAAPIELGAVQTVRKAIRLECARGALARAACYLDNQKYAVRYDNTRLYIGPYGGAANTPLSPKITTLLFTNDVEVMGSGAPFGRFTIATDAPGVADIHIRGRQFGPSNPNVNPVIGLLAQGNVILDSVNGCGANGTNVDMSVNAGIVAETGTLTVPPVWLSDVLQNGTPRCGDLTVNGSLASRQAPVLQGTWEFDNMTYFFQTRNLQWNEAFARHLPTYYPTSAMWKSGAWHETNRDCLLAQNLERCT